VKDPVKFLNDVCDEKLREKVESCILELGNKAFNQDLGLFPFLIYLLASSQDHK